MHRSTHPTEILLGFLAGSIAALFIDQPLVWFLHQFGLTARVAFSTVRTPPMGLEAVWSRVFWGGAFGVAVAYIGVYYELGLRYIVMPAVAIASLRTIYDWVVVPIFSGHAFIGWSADRIVMPLVLNVVWAFATTCILIVFTVVAGTYGERSFFD